MSCGVTPSPLEELAAIPGLLLLLLTLNTDSAGFGPRVRAPASQFDSQGDRRKVVGKRVQAGALQIAQKGGRLAISAMRGAIKEPRGLIDVLARLHGHAHLAPLTAQQEPCSLPAPQRSRRPLLWESPLLGCCRVLG